MTFTYLDHSGKAKSIRTLEEEEYPHYYYKTVAGTESGITDTGSNSQEFPQSPQGTPVVAEPLVKEQHLTFQENQKGISFDVLLALIYAAQVR